MPDDIELRIGKQRLQNFKNYRVDSDLFQAADDFEITVANPGIDIEGGEKCELYVNGQPELVGIIDDVDENIDDSNHDIILRGRDLMSLVVDTDIETGKDLKDTTIKQLAEDLLGPLPYIDKGQIIIGKGGKILPVPFPTQTTGSLWVDTSTIHLNPGNKRFEVLKNYALSLGMLFFYTPGGQFVFGSPITYGMPNYTLIRRKNGLGNNILRGGRKISTAGQYKTVTILAEEQNNLFAVGEHQQSGSATNDDFPLSYKPMVIRGANANDDLDAQAKLEIKKQKFQGQRLEYKVRGHSQSGNNYQPNTVIHVLDEKLQKPVNNAFLVFGRTFERSLENGTTTTLRLSKLGLLPF